ncbi:MAG: GNAT family N-acetyltransferase, partial [Armatimonadetes bacterium]|nr:GNAT family N-acetyltransferase [Armatimonadota bacterium]
MSDTLRTLTPADKPAYLRLMSQAFERGRVIADDNAFWDETFGAETTGIFDGDTMQAVVTVRSFGVHWHASRTGTLFMGGIAGVATHIEARGRGHIDRLLRDALVKMRDAGMVISALYPFSWAFYRRFGWEWVGEKHIITLPLNEIKATPEGRFVREIAPDKARETLTPVYERYAAKFHGVFAVHSHQWKDKLAHSDGRTTFVYGYFPDNAETCEAYLLWRYDGQGSDGGEIREFVADTPAGFRALFGFLHYLGTQCRMAKLSAPSALPVWQQLYHWGIETKIVPVIQARVVDVCAAMEQLAMPQTISPDATVTLQITDDAAPWNNGAFLVSVENGAIRCAPALDLGVSDVSLDIQAFSQAFWGDPALPALRDAGRIEITNERGYKTLAILLPAT